MSTMQLPFTALTCALFGSLFPIYSTHTGWVSCHADYDIVSYQPPQSHFVGAPIDNPPVLAASPGAKIGALMQSHDAYRKQLSYPGYRTRSSSDIVPATSAPSSGLPAGFRDDLSAPWFYRKRSAQYFKHQFDAKLSRLGLHNQPEHVRAYERAEMRRWWLYASCEFRDFLQELSVYQEYIVEIAAELARDKQFAAAVTRACNADSVAWIHAKEVVVRKVIASVSGLEALPVFGKFENFRVMIMGYEVDVSGFISNGIIKLGTVFIPEELQK